MTQLTDVAAGKPGTPGRTLRKRQEVCMQRSTLAGIVAIGLITGVAVAQGKMDCNAMYKGFWDKFNQTKYVSTTGEQLAHIHRLGLRFYDACQSGDEFNARALFDSMATQMN